MIQQTKKASEASDCFTSDFCREGQRYQKENKKKNKNLRLRSYVENISKIYIHI